MGSDLPGDFGRPLSVSQFLGIGTPYRLKSCGRARYMRLWQRRDELKLRTVRNLAERKNRLHGMKLGGQESIIYSTTPVEYTRVFGRKTRGAKRHMVEEGGA